MTRLLSISLLLCASAFGQSNAAFWKLAAVDTASTIADAEVSARRISRTASCHETDALFGHHPSAARYYTQMLSTTAAVNLASYFLRKHHKRIWLAGPITDSALHLGGILQTLQNCP